MDNSWDQVTVYRLITPPVRRWRLVVTITLLTAALAAGVSYLMPEVYTSSTTFTPATGAASGVPAGLANLVTLAGQFGVTTSTGYSPEFFASILKSEELLDSVLNSSFAVPGSLNEQKRLIDLMNVDEDTPAARSYAAKRQLKRMTGVGLESRTGIVSLRVTYADPVLAAAIANRMTQLLNEFNLQRRQFQSREQRRFVEQRLTEAESELRAAERQLRAFLEANRQYRGSPLLEFEADRLQRAVQLKQEVYVALSKAHEDARIAEVRDTPVLTIIDHASPPYRRSAPKRKLYVLLGLVFGGLVSVLAAHFLEPSAGPAVQRDKKELRDALSAARAQATALLRRSSAK